jgi:hypothetical protein
MDAQRQIRASKMKQARGATVIDQFSGGSMLYIGAQ